MSGRKERRLKTVPSAREILYVPNSSSAIALTFDDGPAEWTAPILDTLRDTDVSATFFVIGAAIGGQEPLLMRAAREGHEIGNHALLHRNFNEQETPYTEICDELLQTSNAIESAISQRPTHFRPPGFGSNRRVRNAAGACGFEYVVQAPVWTNDYRSDSATEIADRILSHGNLRSGAIIALHDGRPPDEPAWPAGSRTDRWPTVEAVQIIVPTLLERGFHFLTLSQLIAHGRLPRFRKLARLQSRAGGWPRRRK